MCPYPVCRVPPVPRLFHHVDDGLARLVLGPAFAKLDGHLAVLLALEEADAGKVVYGDAERDRGRLPISFVQPCRRSSGRLHWLRLLAVRRLTVWWFLLILGLVCVYVTYDPPVDMGAIINPY